MTVLAAVVALALFAAGTAVALVVVSQRSMDQVDMGNVGDHDADGDGQPDSGAEPGGVAVEFEEITERTNVLVVGTDSRANLTDQQLIALGTEDDGSNLTDTLMVVQLDPRRDTAAVLSFPRDLYVSLCDGTRGKINSAYAIGEWMEEGGGPECLVDTIEGFTGIAIDHYVQVDLAGFINAVDAIGGVTFYVQEPLRDVGAGLDIDAGCVHFDGTKALSFVRARHIDSDFGRIARQQRFLREMVAKVTSAGVLLNPVRLFSLVREVSSSLTTDSELGLTTQRDLAFSLRELTNEGLVTRTVPGELDMIDGASVVVADEQDSERLFRAFREGTVIPDDVGSAAPSEGPVGEPAEDAEPAWREQVSDVAPVVVLNGAGTSGLATRTAELLESRGFAVARAGDAERFGTARTRILHAPGDRADAEVLAAWLAELGVDARFERGGPGDDLTVVVGEDLDLDVAPSSRAQDDRAQDDRGEAAPTALPSAEPPDFRGAQVSPRSC